MRYLNLLFAGFMLVSLAACGGAGGPDGLLDASGNRLPLSVSAPASLTLPAGQSQSYSILGGRRPYTVKSADARYVTGTVVDDNRLVITAVLPNTLTSTGLTALNVFDVDGKNYTVSVAVPLNLTTTVPQPLAKFVLGEAGAQTYGISGGAGNYSVVSSDTTVLKVTVAAGANNMTVAGVATGSATVTVTDGAGYSVVNDFQVVAIAPADLQIFPDKFSINEGSDTKIKLLIVGGVPPYKAVTSNLDLSSVSVTDGNVLIGVNENNVNRCVGLAPVSTSDSTTAASELKDVTFSITVIDSANTSVTSEMTVVDVGNGEKCP